jgi:DNA-binding LacI/PurR family transcriptional regulator
MRHATIHDIARKLGLSSSTVSRALSNHPDIRRETKERVRAAAHELQYSPNPIAKSLKSSRTTTIGVIVPEIKHDFFASAISGIEAMAYERGFTIVLCQSNESLAREKINVELLANHRVAGIIMSISQETKNGDHLQELFRRKIPLVFFDRVLDDVSTGKVIIDDRRSASTAVSHLVERGYKKIAHFGGPCGLGICEQRKAGYRDALQAAGLAINEEMILIGGLHEEDGYASMERVLSGNWMPDAIFAVNDPVAIGAFQKIKEAGLRIPEDVAILGYSNNRITTLVDPPLTTVFQPSFEMGKEAARILIDGITKNQAESQTIILEAKLIVRRST